METLPKDIIELISKKLNIRDFINYGLCSQNMFSDAAWRRRGEVDFGPFIQVNAFKLNDYRERYLYLAKLFFSIRVDIPNKK